MKAKEMFRRIDYKKERMPNERLISKTLVGKINYKELERERN